MKIVVKVTANTLFDKPEARSSRIKVPIKKSTVIFKKLLMVKGGGGKGSTGGENGHLNRPRYEKRCVRNVFFSFFFAMCRNRGGTQAEADLEWSFFRKRFRGKRKARDAICRTRIRSVVRASPSKSARRREEWKAKNSHSIPFVRFGGLASIDSVKKETEIQADQLAIVSIFIRKQTRTTRNGLWVLDVSVLRNRSSSESVE